MKNWFYQRHEEGNKWRYYILNPEICSSSLNKYPGLTYQEMLIFHYFQKIQIVCLHLLRGMIHGQMEQKDVSCQWNSHPLDCKIWWHPFWTLPERIQKKKMLVLKKDVSFSINWEILPHRYLTQVSYQSYKSCILTILEILLSQKCRNIICYFYLTCKQNI